MSSSSMKLTGLAASIENTKATYKQLGKSGLLVSVPILGAMSFGRSSWGKWVLDEDEVAILSFSSNTSLRDGDMLSQHLFKPGSAHPQGSIRRWRQHLGHSKQLLERRIRNSHRQSHQEIQHSATQTPHLHKIMESRLRARRFVHLSALRRVAGQQRLRQSVWALAICHLQQCRSEPQTPRHELHRSSSNPQV